MKRTERHHLKENELAQRLTAATEFVESNRQQLMTIVGGIVVVALIAGGIYAWRARTDSRGQDLLADAMTTLNARVVPATPATATTPGELPAAASMGALGTYSSQEAKLTAALPKLKAAADAFPDSPAGITARYHYAGTLAALGRHQDAIAAFDEVTAKAGGSIYGRMATLGKADTQTKAGQLDQAITSWKSLVDQKDASIPEDAILMELAKAYQAKGNVEEARKTFTQLVDQHPTSPYVAEARAELELLKS
ncbi:MAG: tetratricopeptide repeat protein [Vicinamibacterales bacterium]